MYALLLGNGFDINYDLPTKYINFLNTVHYMIENSSLEMKTVGDVFGASDLRAMDNVIRKSYEMYKSVYDAVPLCESVRTSLIALQNNFWFAYLWKSFNKDLGWIDFEKEISSVIHCLQDLISGEVSFLPNKFSQRPEAKFFVEHFEFLLIEDGSYHPAVLGERRFRPDYMMTYPHGSKHFIINRQKIVEVFENTRKELADGLRLYLRNFVDMPVEKLCEKNDLRRFEAFTGIEQVITFNYTNTYEKVYLTSKVFHIHGNVQDKIVLGVNPDRYDEVENVNTDLISFKKYFQRTMFSTDREYIDWLEEQKGLSDNVSLMVMGHSLDVTDKDIIMQLFDISYEIFILYYSEESKASLIANLVKMYGKEGFDGLKHNKRLTFLPQYMDFSEFAKQRSEEQIGQMIQTFTF